MYLPVSYPIAALALAKLSKAITLTGDPSLTMDLAADAADNAILADYDITVVDYLFTALVATTEYNGSSEDTSVSDLTFTATLNDTDALLINECTVTLTDCKVVKHGYSSNLFEASFFGVNSALNVQNSSTVTINTINVTTHNGAANIYAWGEGTTINVSDAWLYSSGPAAHGLYAAEYGTIVGTNIRHYSGGNRCSSFAGDSPAGYVTVSDSVAHTAGIGSGIFYALGTITASNVTGWAENAPVLFMDGEQTATISNSTLEAGLLGGIVVFSSSEIVSGATVKFTDTTLIATGDTMPALWFGNIIADITLETTTLTTASGVLVSANYSQVTQAFDYYADYSDNSALSPAQVTVTVIDSDLTGDLVAYNESTISWSLTESSSWTGTTSIGYGSAYFAVSLDATSSWTLTADTCLENFTDSDTTVSNVASAGFSIYYDSTSTANDWLDGATISLSGGGSLEPGSC
ncbi:hypothetical protein V8E51_000331 [Hyaloscypha variabilis]|jgi:hypothetical protein